MKNEGKKKSNLGRNLALVGLTVVVMGVSYVAIDKNNEAETAKTEAQAEREQLRSDYLASFQQIEENLYEISAHESVVRNNLMKGDNQLLSVEERVQQEIAIIEGLIAENNKTIADLQSKVSENDDLLADYTAKNSRLERKLGSFKSKIGELEEMNELLAQELKTTKEEKADMTNQLAFATSANKELSELYMGEAEISRLKDEEIAELNEDLNASYYVVGEFKELKEMDVVEKDGGIIGIGATKTLKSDFDKESFTEIDRRSYKTIPVFAKKAELATNHPADSYVWVEGDDGVQWLEIVKPADFWQASKYLVILTDEGLFNKSA